MHTAGGQTDKHVTDVDFGAVDEFGFLDRAYGEASDVVFIHIVHVGHLRRFAADEGTVGEDAAVGHAFHNRLNLSGFVLAHGDIIQEEEGSCALREHVVHAHSHRILTDSVVAVHHERQFQFGAYAVGAADQHGFFIAEGGEVEHATEATDVAHHAGTVGAGNMFLDEAH